MKLNQWQPVGRKKPVVEIAAVGNTEIEGKKFRAIASQLTYTEQNENILLEGLRRENAKIWFRKNDKIQRLLQLVVKGQPDEVGENIQDTYEDLSVYGIISQIVQRGKWAK